MRIIITGISGLLGSELYRAFSDDKNKYDLRGVSRRRPPYLAPEKHIPADIADYEDVFQKITRLNPEVIINTAALSNVDECERNPDEAYRINALGARNMALAARRFDSYLVHISTDYVFGGKPPQSPDGYSEYEEPSPMSQYGRTKLWGEYMIRESGAAFSIIRTSWIFGSARSNYITQFADGKNIIPACEDMVSSPTYAPDLAGAIKELVESSLSRRTECHLRRNGIYHITNSGYASRYEIGVFVAKTLKNTSSPDEKIRKVRLADLKEMVARRPNFSALKNILWKLDGFRTLRKWQEAVKEFILNR